MSKQGYADPIYARAVAGDQMPVELTRSGAALIPRSIDAVDPGGEPAVDASAPYPLLACADWTALAEDLEALDDTFVSVSAVCDPLGGWSEDELRAAFPDLARPYKEHFVVDLSQPVEESASSHHRRDARRGMRRVAVTCVDADEASADRELLQADWRRLYGELITRHGVVGPAAFDIRALDALWDVPGMSVYRASVDGVSVAMQLWLRDGPIVRYHLAAQDAAGYREGGAYALTWTALQDFAREGCEIAHLGAAAGDASSTEDGLSRFKRGWATGTRTAWLCGRIGDPARYEALARAKGLDPEDTSWFPLYRRALTIAP